MSGGPSAGNGPLRRFRALVFWVAAGLALLDAVLLFYKTKLVDHPEFVSFPKVAIAFFIWMGLMTAALLSERQKLFRFSVVFAVTLVLVFPAFIQVARFITRLL